MAGFRPSDHDKETRKEAVELKRTQLAVAREKAVVVGAASGTADFVQESLDELKRLAATAGAKVIGELVQHLRAPNPATYLGTGKVEELAGLCRALNADVIIFDVELSASQLRNLERATDRKVVDRAELILDIFAQGARTAMACDQVELAQLEYTFPRLVRMWTHLERIEGGIGMRGPGERQIETDRRLVRKRIQDLKRRIGRNLRRREVEVRGRQDEFTVCLVGYTNAGKSTLMNALTQAGVFAGDRLFATLDTRTRVLDLGEGRRALLSDTVGFIRKLPHHLVASFQATLAEAREADMLLHVVDASSPHAEHEMAAAMEVLEEMECEEHAILPVYNKMDAVEDESVLPLLRHRFGEGVCVSALSGEGLETLRERIREACDSRAATLHIEMPPAAGRLQAYLMEHGDVFQEEYGAEHVRMDVRIGKRHIGAIRRMGGRISGNGQDAGED